MNCVTLGSLGRRAVILLVEDNADHVLLTQLAFEEAKIEVDLQVARDGIECMEFLNRSGAYANTPRPDLILLDIHMPRMDGYEVLRRIRADDALRLLPVNVLSTSGDLLDVKRMHELGCNSYIVKSNNFEHFTESMQQMVHYWLNVVVLPATVQD